jgi:cytochrome c-type biogenesis protein
MDLSEGFSQALAAGNMVALPLALLGGLVAGMNPCCLALYPAAAVACCSTQGQTIKRTLGNAMAFVLGIAVAVASLGVLAAYVGRMAVMGTPFKYAIAFLPLIMGVYRLGWIRLPLFAPKAFRPGIGGAFGTGLLLSLIIGPCGTPVLVSVLSFASTSRASCMAGCCYFSTVSATACR